MKQKILLLSILLSASLWGGFSHIDCTDEGNLTVLHITEGDCKAIEAFWDATGQGDGWNDTTGWDTLVSAEDWYGIALHDNGVGIKAFYPDNNNMSGILPEELGTFTNLEYFVISRNHFSNIPNSIKHMQSLLTLSIADNEFTGSLLNDLDLPNLTSLALSDNNFTGTIPQSYANLTNLKKLRLQNNNLSGALPDLSALTHLSIFEIYRNQFTFADIEPQMGWIRNVVGADYTSQGNLEDPLRSTGHCHNRFIDELENIVYFDGDLKLVASIPTNPSHHDFYTWYKEGTTDPIETDVVGNTYIIQNATEADNGRYYYDANNTEVTRDFYPLKTHMLLCGSRFGKGILAIHDNAPAVGNYPPTHLEIHAGDNYSYTPSVTDADGDTLQFTIADKPGWMTFESATGRVYGTPDNADVGTYDINITVTDLTPDAEPKISVPIRYTLTVLPASVTATAGGYQHDTTSSKIISTLTPTLQAYLESDPQSFGFMESNSCDSGSKAYIGLESSGALITGYKVCNTGDFSATLATGSYPNATTATLLPDTTDSTKAMIMIDIPLGTNSITIGE